MRELKAAECDYIVCLGHMGIDASSDGCRSVDVLEKVGGIDLFLDGHSHSTLEQVIAVTNPEHTVNGGVLTSTGTGFQSIGVAKLAKTGVTAETFTPDAVTAYLGTAGSEAAAPVAARWAEIKVEIGAAYGAVFARSEVTLNDAKAGPGNRNSETNNGDLITDAMLWTVLKDKGSLTVKDDHVVAITNGGGIRAAIQPGNVTKKDINSVLPFGNTLCVVYVTGAELLEALEASTYCTPEQVGGFPQVAGIRYTVDTGKPYDANDTPYPGSTYYGPKSIQRVTINDINGRAFDPKATYAVVTTDFCAAGGDTYYAFASASAQFDTGIHLDETVMEYITDALGGVIGEKYAAPQGRITILATEEAAPADEPTAAPDSYTVAEGDCLWSIADRFYGDGAKYVRIAQANGLKNPDLIRPGKTLIIPAA